MPFHRINFVDFHPLFSPSGNSMIACLRPHFDIELSNEPEFLFYSVFGTTHTRPQFNHCIKIWCTEENFRPNFTKCDYALTFDHLDNDPRHLRLPLYVRYLFHHWQNTGRELIKPPDFNPSAILASKTKFCNFVYSNANAKTRIEFFHKLSKYKKVDSGGAVLNNLKHRPSNKLEFIQPYKFTIAFENSSWPGYVTEKLVEPMLMDSIPIYWGSPTVGHEFNSRSFINCHDHLSLDEAVKQVILLDNDDEAYLAKIREPWFPDNVANKYCQPDYLIPFFTKVFAEKPHSHPKWKNTVPLNFSTMARNSRRT
jgi:hypothetical protein